MRFFLQLPAIRAEVFATPEALGVVATYLAARSKVDPRSLVALGASLGVPPLAALASRDPRPRAVALLYMGGPLDRISEANLRDGVRWAWLRRAVAGALGSALRRLEPTRTLGGIAPRPLLVIGAAGDPWVPPRTVDALFAAARQPKRLVWPHGEHLRTSDAALSETLSDTIRVWLDSIMP